MLPLGITCVQLRLLLYLLFYCFTASRYSSNQVHTRTHTHTHRHTQTVTYSRTYTHAHPHIRRLSPPLVCPLHPHPCTQYTSFGGRLALTTSVVIPRLRFGAGHADVRADRTSQRELRIHRPCACRCPNCSCGRRRDRGVGQRHPTFA